MREMPHLSGIQWGFDLEQILLDLWLKAAGIGGSDL